MPLRSWAEAVSYTHLDVYKRQILAGGHSINDTDVKYGLSVMGLVYPDRIWSNNGGRPGDRLIFTKKLGVGIVCTANRVREASEEAIAEAIASMTTLNKTASELSLIHI